MPRAIILDTFPLSCISKSQGIVIGETDQCRDWIFSCATAGNPIYAPEIAYYEVLRELERRGANSQRAKLKAFCNALPNRYIPITTEILEASAILWGQSRNMGKQTSNDSAIDGDMILIAQALSLNLLPDEYVIATTNEKHLSPFAQASHWKSIPPGS